MALKFDPKTWEISDPGLNLTVENRGGNSEGFFHRTFVTPDWTMKFTFQSGAAIGKSGFQIWMENPVGNCQIDAEDLRLLLKQYIRLFSYNPHTMTEPPDFQDFYF
jgi:hypothetical protein